jgi:hypothetical protein
MNYMAMMLSSLVVPILIFGIIIFFYLRQKKSEAGKIPPLDLIDAKKLDTTVASKVQAALLPLLQEEGYSDQDIEKILVRTSLLGKPGSK